METQSPFSFLDGLFKKFASGPQVPQWLVTEVQHRAVLLVNHVLMQEKEAVERLTRQRGKVVRMVWRTFSVQWLITPAGLLDRADVAAVPDLQIQVAEDSPLNLARDALRGDKPAIRIEGDVQLAAEINWLADNLRWDVEDDLARVVGDAPARAVAGGARKISEALRQFVGNRFRRAGPDGSADHCGSAAS